MTKIYYTFEEIKGRLFIGQSIDPALKLPDIPEDQYRAVTYFLNAHGRAHLRTELEAVLDSLPLSPEILESWGIEVEDIINCNCSAGSSMTFEVSPRNTWHGRPHVISFNNEHFNFRIEDC